MAQDKPPTQAELQKMMKEAQKQLDNLDPETKRMMDSMGIKMPDMKKTGQKLSKIPDAQLAEAWDEQTRIVPKKDAVRIAAIPAAVSAAGMGTYIGSSQSKLFARLQPAVKTVGEKLYASYKAAGKSSAEIGNAAAALFMIGRNQTGFYLMSKVCAADPGNTDNVGNYAAMLSMMGAEQLAIPILNNLNSRFPRNGTILNNLGQAWFGLGETVKAERYLDSTIRIFGAHTQANLTKAKIEESKGNKTEAVNLVRKSLQTAYSQEKDAYLHKLGSEPGKNDMHLPRPSSADPMNLGSFMQPPFPKSVMECVLLEPQWREFDRTLDEEIAKLKKQQVSDPNAAAKSLLTRTLQSGGAVPLYLEAGKKGLRETEESYWRKIDELKERMTTFEDGPGKQLKDTYEKTMARLKKEDNDQTGEGKPNVDFCPKYQKTSDEYLQKVNTEYENWTKDFLMASKVYVNECAYYEMYMLFPEEYEMLKPGLKASWLTFLKTHNFRSITADVCKVREDNKPQGSKLAEFDDVACQYHSSMSYVVGTITVNCSRMETNLDLGSVKLGLKQNMDKEGFEDQFVSCTVAVSAGKSAKIGGVGPLEVEVGADVTGIIEIDRSGVKDVVIEGSVGISAGSTVISDAAKANKGVGKVAGHGIGDGSASVGINGRISLVSGATSSDGFSFSKGGGIK